MANLFRSFGTGEERSCSLSKHGRKLGHVEYLFLVLCLILGVVSLGWGLLDSVVDITIVESAVGSGAVCLDGSPPAYYLDIGSGEGANNWLLFHEGGAWCQNADDCLQRSYTQLGSSTQMPASITFVGMVSDSPVENPDFYNWNRVYLKYCDGGSFNGDVSDPMQVNGTGPSVNIFLRGQRIWEAVMEDLMEKGMKDAQKALLSGCSAGGLTAFLHCDQYRDLMPTTTLVKCVSDAAFFLDIPDVSGVQTIATFFADVVQVHNMTANLPKYCVSADDAARCIFPEYIIPGLQTPFFVLNAAYDSWQMSNILVPPSADPTGIWNNCKSDLSLCSEAQLQVVQGFRESLLEKLQPLLESAQDGAFIDSCHRHCQSDDDGIWNGLSPLVDNKTITEVVADWYFERNSTKVIDCPYPCNPCQG